jgi:hypothetical protein
MLSLPLMVVQLVPKPILRGKVSSCLQYLSKLKADLVRVSGSSLLMTASRIDTLLESSHQPFPPLPGNATEFFTTGINQRPTFFGCFPAQFPPEYPMVIYLPNSPPLHGADPVTK